jgi:hypothetical protein
VNSDIWRSFGPIGVKIVRPSLFLIHDLDLPALCRTPLRLLSSRLASGFRRVDRTLYRLCNPHALVSQSMSISFAADSSKANHVARRQALDVLGEMLAGEAEPDVIDHIMTLMGTMGPSSSSSSAASTSHNDNDNDEKLISGDADSDDDDDDNDDETESKAASSSTTAAAATTIDDGDVDNPIETLENELEFDPSSLQRWENQEDLLLGLHQRAGKYQPIDDHAIPAIFLRATNR